MDGVGATEGEPPEGVARGVLDRGLLEPTFADWLDGAPDDAFGFGWSASRVRLEVRDEDEPLCRVDAEPGEEVVRPILESRIVGVAVAFRLESPSPEPGELGRAVASIPLPSVDRPFGRQLALLWRRSRSAEAPASVDWAIERVVAELYNLEISELVALQSFCRGR